MNKVVHKYPLHVGKVQQLEVPVGAKVLSVQVQGSSLCLWALVNADPEGRKRMIRVAVLATGQEVKESIKDWDYVGTAMMMDGLFVWHVFTATNPSIPAP